MMSKKKKNFLRDFNEWVAEIKNIVKNSSLMHFHFNKSFLSPLNSLVAIT